MTNYEEMNSKQLKEIAKEKKVKNWWNLKKDELIAELRKLEAPKKKPTSNKKKGALIEYNDKAQNICAWAKELGVSANTLYHRIYYKHLSVEEAFETPIRGKGMNK